MVAGIVLIGLLGVLLGFYLGSRSSTGRRVLKIKKNKAADLWGSYRMREEASPELQQTLLKLVGGNPQEAERLVSRARFGHPGKSESHYWLRAIQEAELQRQQKSQD
jgi:uncharacterized protein HemY